jgi:enamine deaminase RidA (YjgF/YER057c/UK114 family)
VKARLSDRAGTDWDKEFLTFVPSSGTAFHEQVCECLLKLRAALRTKGLGPGQVLKLAFFVRASGPPDYDRKKTSVGADVRALFPGARPALSVIAQPPAGGLAASLEAMVLGRPSRSVEVIPKSFRGIPYVLVRAEGGREVVAAGISGGEKGTSGARATAAFVKAAGLLGREGLMMGDIVRQWNFIENILGGPRGDARIRQNYQIFNDIRASAFAAAGLRTGFPAATGIGMNTGGIILEFVAGAGKAVENSLAVSNPRQVDAHRYSRGVLVGAPLSRCAEKHTPKFERGRVVFSGTSGICYVSGTAAIVGEEVVGHGDVARQTKATIRNIERLITLRNLRAAGAPVRSVGPRFAYVRTYVKNENDVPDVRKIVRGAFGDAPATFVVADICREDLLVEIEGAVRVRTD